MPLSQSSAPAYGEPALSIFQVLLKCHSSTEVILAQHQVECIVTFSMCGTLMRTPIYMEAHTHVHICMPEEDSRSLGLLLSVSLTEPGTSISPRLAGRPAPRIYQSQHLNTKVQA